MGARRRRVLLPQSEWEPFSQLRRGVLQYARERGRWIIEVLPETLPLVFPQLARWEGDGAVLLIRSAAQLRCARRLPYPVVNGSALLPPGPIPRARPDDRAVGRMAAEHLMSLGLRRFLFFGRRGPYNIGQRERGFRDRLAEAGFACASHYARFPYDSWRAWQRVQSGLEAFLRRARKPFGMLGCDDFHGRLLMDACGRLDIRVPEDAAVMGIDNAEHVCAFCDPPMTSIDRNMERVGYETAVLLDRLMAGRKPPAGDIVVPPGRLVRRRSTDTIGVEDPRVRAVVEYIREHMGETFGVERLVPLVPVSRRWLERHFRKELGCGLHQYLCGARVARAKDLLAGERKMKAGEIARACGFASARRFRIVFRRVTGMKPAEYGRRHAIENPSRIGQAAS